MVLKEQNVFAALGNLLHHPVFGDWNRLDGVALGAARMDGTERLGQQLFLVAGCPQDRLWSSTPGLVRLGARSSLRPRHSEPRDVRLGIDSFSTDRAGAGRWCAFYEKLRLTFRRARHRK